MGSANIVTLTEANFEEEVLQSSVPVLVDFWAEWCGPCKMLAPVLDQLADEMVGKVKIGKVDVDHNQQLAGKYGIMNIPTLLLFKGGEVTEQMVGAGSKKSIKDKLDLSLA